MTPSDRSPEETVKAVQADQLAERILSSRGGRRLLAMDDRAMREFLTSAASSLSVRPTDDPDLKDTLAAARAETRQRMDVVLSADIAHVLGLAGALTALDEAGYTARNCAGVSGGAIVAALLATGYLPNEITRLLNALALRPAPKRNLVPPRPEEIRDTPALVRWLRERLEDKGVVAFRDLMLVSELRLSTSLQALAERMPDDVAAVEVLGALLPAHPSYGGGRAATVKLEVPAADAPRKPVGDWFYAASELFAADSSFMLDGRRLVCALAYLDAATCEALSRDGVLAEVEREVGTLDAELNDHGLRLREDCRGERAAQPRTPGPAPEAAARESRLQVVVHERQGGRLSILPRDARVLGENAGDLPVADLAVGAAARAPFKPVDRVTPAGNTLSYQDAGHAGGSPVGLFDVSDGEPAWPTFGIVVAVPGEAATPPPVDAARTIVVLATAPAPEGLDMTLYEAGYAACREFLAGWDFARWRETFRRATA